MKIWKKTLISLLAPGLILLTMGGSIVAKQKTQRVVVWTGTQHNSDSFTATEPEGHPWSWAIKMHQSVHAGNLYVRDTTTGQIILDVYTYVDDGGSLTGSIHNGHTYIVLTSSGNEPLPGYATCSVSSADYEPEGPQGP